MRRIFFILAIYLSLAGQIKAQESESFALLELFTSEGCSSCPPAEKIFSALSDEAEKSGKKIFFLAYHVDYWNRMGWKDPYSKYQFTMRQENYSRVLPSKELYTPQLVINGSSEFTGSDEKGIRSGIQKALSQKNAIRLMVKLDSLLRDTAYVSWELGASDKNHSLHLAFTESGLSSSILKGENQGKTLTHHHVVRQHSTVGSPGLKGTKKIPLKDFNPGKNTRIIAFLQHKQNYKVLGATFVEY